jgi:hypothetical protein
VDGTGNVVYPVGLDLTGVTQVYRECRNNSARGFIEVKNFSFDGTTANNQMLFSIERNEVVLQNITATDADMATENRLIHCDHAAHVHLDTIVLPAQEWGGAFGTYSISIHECAEVWLNDCSVTGVDRWGQMSSKHCNGVKITNCNLNKVDAHDGIHNLTVTGCRINEDSIKIGWGTGFLKVYNNHFQNCGAAEVLDGFFGGWWGTWDFLDNTFNTKTYDLVVVDMGSASAHPIGGFTETYPLPEITIDGVKRLRNDSYDLENYVSVTPLAIDIDTNSVGMYAPTKVSIKNISCEGQWRLGVSIPYEDMTKETSEVFRPLCTLENVYTNNDKGSAAAFLIPAQKVSGAGVPVEMHFRNCTAFTADVTNLSDGLVFAYGCEISALITDCDTHVTGCEFKAPASNLSGSEVFGSSGNINVIRSSTFRGSGWDLSNASIVSSSDVGGNFSVPTLPPGHRSTEVNGVDVVEWFGVTAEVVNVYVDTAASGSASGEDSSNAMLLEDGIEYIRDRMVGASNTVFRLRMAAGTYTPTTRHLFWDGEGDQLWHFGSNRLVIKGQPVSGATPTTIVDGTTLGTNWFRQDDHQATAAHVAVEDISLTGFGTDKVPFMLRYGGGSVYFENVHSDCAGGILDSRNCVVEVFGSDSSNPTIVSGYTDYAIWAQDSYVRVGDDLGLPGTGEIDFTGAGSTAFAINASRKTVGYVRGCTHVSGGGLLRIEKFGRIRTQGNTGTAWSTAFVSLDATSIWDTDDAYPDTLSGTSATSPVLKVFGQTFPFENAGSSEISHRSFRGPEFTIRPDTLAAMSSVQLGKNYEVATVAGADWSSIGGPASATVGDTFVCTSASADISALGTAYLLDLDLSEASSGGDEAAGVARLPEYFWYSPTAMLRFHYFLEVIADDPVTLEIAAGSDLLGEVELTDVYTAAGTVEKWSVKGAIFGSDDTTGAGTYCFEAFMSGSATGGTFASGDTDSWSSDSRDASTSNLDHACILKFQKSSDRVVVKAMQSWATP